MLWQWKKHVKMPVLPERLIPVPRAISAGCGLSWCAALEDREEIRSVMKAAGIEEEELHECMV